MLNNEVRKLLVEGYEAAHNAKEIAKIFHVNKYTVYHLEELKRKTGSVELQTWRRGRKALLNSEDKARIAQCITNNPTISLEELRAQLGLKVSISTMSRVVRALRAKCKELNLKAEHDNLVFLDESGVNINMTRRYGRAIGKSRVHCSVPLNTPPTQTILSSVHLNGQTTAQTIAA